MYSLVDDIKRKREAEDDARWWRDNCRLQKAGMAFKREKQQLHRMSMDSSMEPSSVQCSHCNDILCDITEYQQHFFALHQ